MTHPVARVTSDTTCAISSFQKQNEVPPTFHATRPPPLWALPSPSGLVLGSHLPHLGSLLPTPPFPTALGHLCPCFLRSPLAYQLLRSWDVALSSHDAVITSGLQRLQGWGIRKSSLLLSTQRPTDGLSFHPPPWMPCSAMMKQTFSWRPMW